MTAPQAAVSDAVPEGLREAILGNFVAHAAENGLPGDLRDLAVTMSRDGRPVGGLIGRTGRGWLVIDLVALPADGRGTGLGRTIMAQAEAEAVRRGCHGAFLNTMAFMAPGFYARLGYTEFARLEDNDPRLTRIWYSKRLIAGPPDSGTPSL